MGKSERPIEVIARGALLRDGHVLLCRSVEHGYSYLPGGHVEFGEAAAAAVERELEEEAGLKVRAGRLALVTEAAFSTRKKDHHEVNLVFHVEPMAPLKGGNPPPPIRSREPEIAFDWVELAAIPETDVRPDAVRAWLAARGSRSTG
jgi:8-oxo-dGTP diphosphatase